MTESECPENKKKIDYGCRRCGGFLICNVFTGTEEGKKIIKSHTEIMAERNNKIECKICGRDMKLDGGIANTSGYCRLCHIEEDIKNLDAALSESRKRFE